MFGIFKLYGGLKTNFQAKVRHVVVGFSASSESNAVSNIVAIPNTG